MNLFTFTHRQKKWFSLRSNLFSLNFFVSSQLNSLPNPSHPSLPLRNKIFTRFFCVYGRKVLIYSNFHWFYAESCSMRHECYSTNTIISSTLNRFFLSWYMLLIVKLIVWDIFSAAESKIRALGRGHVICSKLLFSNCPVSRQAVIVDEWAKQWSSGAA